MRAWRIHGYGGPEVLALERVPVPVPGPGELLLRVAAASVNPIDWKMRSGHLRDVFPLAFPRVLGRDCAGTVVAVGEGVTGAAPGAAAAGVADPAKDGTHAEYAILPAVQAAPLPAGLAPAAAACLCVSGLSAYVPLVEDAGVAAGMRVLVHGGAGGVGGLAIQIARHLGAEVLATCGAGNRDYCVALGAARAIDYAAGDFVAAAGPCDVVLDTVGGAVHARSLAALRPGGVLVALAAAPVPAGAARADVTVIRSRIRPTRERLARLFDWAVRGIVAPQIRATFRFEDLPEAYRMSETGHARGKLIVALA
ncbi:MAG: NADP-dependent oxidoreductase [Burkholderiales bacterium]|nr:NADP-dependent oxidoreductase [Burkholderiales bacterium]